MPSNAPSIDSPSKLSIDTSKHDSTDPTKVSPTDSPTSSTSSLLDFLTDEDGIPLTEEEIHLEAQKALEYFKAMDSLGSSLKEATSSINAQLSLLEENLALQKSVKELMAMGIGDEAQMGGKREGEKGEMSGKDMKKSGGVQKGEKSLKGVGGEEKNNGKA